jgi:hypothetical protein
MVKGYNVSYGWCKLPPVLPLNLIVSYNYEWNSFLFTNPR